MYSHIRQVCDEIQVDCRSGAVRALVAQLWHILSESGRTIADAYVLAAEMDSFSEPIPDVEEIESPSGRRNLILQALRAGVNVFSPEESRRGDSVRLVIAMAMAITSPKFAIGIDSTIESRQGIFNDAGITPLQFDEVWRDRSIAGWSVNAMDLLASYALLMIDRAIDAISTEDALGAAAYMAEAARCVSEASFDGGNDYRVQEHQKLKSENASRAARVRHDSSDEAAQKREILAYLKTESLRGKSHEQVADLVYRDKFNGVEITMSHRTIVGHISSWRKQGLLEKKVKPSAT